MRKDGEQRLMCFYRFSYLFQLCLRGRILNLATVDHEVDLWLDDPSSNPFFARKMNVIKGK